MTGQVMGTFIFVPKYVRRLSDIGEYLGHSTNIEEDLEVVGIVSASVAVLKEVLQIDVFVCTGFQVA
ncbi:hypothetical protein PN498_04910 [Oscillatoria sp. CS-180]|uniref:hypothetical protein n=1 Tax=Oscillatoria sp. CS-180 TaxID=3021720 RepID=UPI00232EB19D|nr:hypothetical protein [Oscillatoria sp. CS-180]MDB9525318.1 hypothetical protein [Oscillatoria sp. CS-180]